MFYSELKLALEKKEWEAERNGKYGKSKGANEASGGGIGEHSRTASCDLSLNYVVALDAILRGIDLDARERESTMEDALRDLDALMMNAKEMVSLPLSLLLLGPNAVP